MASKGRPYRRVVFEGFEILIGRGAQENDHLSFGVAAQSDAWLHVAGGTPGSHVVIRNPDKLPLPKSVVERAASHAAWFSKAKNAATAEVHGFDVAAATMAKPDSVDRVLTFRNIHNLLMPEDGGAKDGSVARAFFRAAFKALKPGGVLGIVDHRLPEKADVTREQTSGYVKRSTVVRLATQAGFRLAGENEVNANAKDTADWPNGVWTLPPTLSQKDQDRARYLAIGESDRMTLRFVKPR